MTGATAHPVLNNLIISRRLNQGLGGAFFTPFDIGALDDVTIDLIIEYTGGRPKMVEGLRKVESIRAQWLKDVKYYRNN